LKIGFLGVIEGRFYVEDDAFGSCLDELFENDNADY
jgi:hypothetical protein